MENKCQVDDASSINSPRISNGFPTSVVEVKTNISTISMEKVQSSDPTPISSDVRLSVQESNKDRKVVIPQKPKSIKRNATVGVVESKSLLPQECNEAERLNSLDSVDKSHFEPDTNGHVHTTPTYESKNVHQSETVASGDHYPQKFLQRSIHKSTSSNHSADIFEPITVVAKVGVPVGKPKKPLQFVGELGWRRSGTASAFRPTFDKNSENRNKVGDNSKSCCSRKSLLSQGIDLNVAPIMETDLPTDDIIMSVSSNQPQPCLLGLYSESGNDVNHHKHGNHVIQHQQVTQNRVGFEFDTSTCCRGSERKPIFEGRRASCWFGSNSVRGFDHGQTRPLFVGMAPAEQVRMVGTIQSEVSFFPQPPCGVYINGLSPTIHPSFVSQRNCHNVPVLASYPTTPNVIDNCQRLNPNRVVNLRPTLIQNRNVGFVENGRRALADYTSKRREANGGWDTCSISYKRVAP